jgi:GrpB-like predicted nucleotidyltransferase (UPF0157 family)
MSASDEPAKALDEPVEIEVWNPAWPRLARSLIAELAEHLCPECRIEHIGSTALEGMPAKPVIDLMVGVKDEAEQDACARLLSSAGWQDMGEAGVPGRRHLRRRLGEHANVHIVSTKSLHWSNNLAIRDYLRAHPDERAAYGRLKRSLTEGATVRLLAYSDRKAAFMATLLERATAWRTEAR